MFFCLTPVKNNYKLPAIHYNYIFKLLYYMKLDVFDEKIAERLGFPFDYWAYYGKFSITEQDFIYLENIKNHPCFPIILESHQILSPILDWASTRINEIVFYERFYNDSACPKGVKDILFTMIGLERGILEEHNMLDLLDFRYHYAEQWLSVTQKTLLR